MSEDRIDIALAEAYEGKLSAAKSRIAELEAEVMEFKSRGNVAMSSWDEERERALREGERVVALEAEVKTLREALIDMRSGWKYIRETHGDLYGVGWDRAQNKADAALAAGEGMGQSVVLLRQYATLLKMTTEGTDALVAGLSEEANIVHCYEEMTNLCRTYEQRLKVVEAETVDRCAKVCDLLAENHKHIAGESQQGRIDAEPFIHTAQTLAKAIRALEEKK